jgi:transposase-like protein
MEHTAQCPYCGEFVTLWLDLGGARQSRYVEDCAVCCRPWQVHVSPGEDGEPQVQLLRQDA